MSHHKRFTLYYWNTRALGEPVRALLAHLYPSDWEQVKYEVGAPPLYDKSQWLQEKESFCTAFSNLPLLVDHKRCVKLPQSRAIARYLCRSAVEEGASAAEGLLGHSLEEATRADVCTEAVFDMWASMFECTYCDAPQYYTDFDLTCHQQGATQCLPGSRFEAILRKYRTETLPRNLQRIEKHLSDFTESQEALTWTAGSHLTYADFFICEFLEQNRFLVPDCLQEFPCSHSLLERFLSLPFMKAYRSSHNYAVEPFHNRYSHFHRGWAVAD